MKHFIQTKTIRAVSKAGKPQRRRVAWQPAKSPRRSRNTRTAANHPSARLQTAKQILLHRTLKTRIRHWRSRLRHHPRTFSCRPASAWCACVTECFFVILIFISTILVCKFVTKEYVCFLMIMCYWLLQVLISKCCTCFVECKTLHSYS